MGYASGLFIKETTIKVVYISDQPMSLELLQLDWQWESKGYLSKILGVFIGDDISLASMVNSLTMYEVGRSIGQSTVATPHSFG